MNAHASEKLDASHKDTRARQRREFTEPLTVLLAESGRYLGRLRNLTVSGLRLDSEIPFAEGRTIPARIRTPGSPDGRRYIDVTLQCRWCHPAHARGTYAAGFRFVNTTFRQKLLLQTLMNGESPDYAEFDEPEA